MHHTIQACEGTIMSGPASFLLDIYSVSSEQKQQTVLTWSQQSTHTSHLIPSPPSSFSWVALSPTS